MFEGLVADAVEGLPEEFRQKLENIDIVVEEYPTPEAIKKFGLIGSESLMGYYQGVPFPARAHYYSNVMPDKITIFKGNIEKVCQSDDEIKAVVARTVRHEIAHYFGISDEHMKESGTY